MGKDESRSAGAIRCFVIGPIGDPHGEPASEKRRYEDAKQVLDVVITPACRVFGLNPVRADQMSRPGEITEQVFRTLRDADVVIADVTHGNANVMYELGLRHTLDFITIPIGETGSLPFDISTIRTIKFVRTADGLREAREKLTATLDSALTAGFDPVTATRVWSTIIRSRREKPLGFEEPGRLERVPKMKSALKDLTNKSFPTAEDVLNQVFRAVSRLGESKEKLDQRNAQSEDYEPMISETGEILREQAERVEQLDWKLRQQVFLIVSGMNHLIEKFSRNPDDPEIPDMTKVPAYVEALQSSFRTVGAHSAKCLQGLSEMAAEFRAPVAEIAAFYRRAPKYLRPLSDVRVQMQRVVDEYQKRHGSEAPGSS